MSSGSHASAWISSMGREGSVTTRSFWSWLANKELAGVVLAALFACVFWSIFWWSKTDLYCGSLAFAYINNVIQLTRACKASPRSPLKSLSAGHAQSIRALFVPFLPSSFPLQPPLILVEGRGLRGIPVNYLAIINAHLAAARQIRF